MLVIGITLGSQLWRERGYFLWEATCYDELQREGYSKQYAILKAKKRLCLKECEREKQELREHWDQVQKNRKEYRRKVEELETLNVSSIDNELFRSEWRDHMMQLRYKMERGQEDYDEIEKHLRTRYNSISKMEAKHWEYFRKKEEKLIKKYGPWINGHESFAGETISSN